MEYTMIPRVKGRHPAFKHGGYSATTFLPGEDRAKFDQLHRDLIAEYNPEGPLEKHLVTELARLIWRRDNVSIFRVAKTAREPFINSEKDLPSYSHTPDNVE